MAVHDRDSAFQAAARSVLLPDVLLVEDLARLIRVSPSAVRALIRHGQIPARKLGRRWIIERGALLRSLSPDDATSRFRLLPKDRRDQP